MVRATWFFEYNGKRHSVKSSEELHARKLAANFFKTNEIDRNLILVKKEMKPISIKK